MLFSTNRFNLLAALPELEKISQFKEISRKIRQHASLESVSFDADRAQELIEIAMKFGLSTEKPKAEPIIQNSEYAAIIGALTFRAIILYTSATHTSSHASIGRFKVGLRDAPQEIRDAHARLCGLRDSALAHYGTGDHHSPRPWIKEALILNISPEELSLGVAGTRSNYTAQANQDLQDCVNFLRAVITERRKREEPALIAMIDDTLKHNDFIKILSNNPYDPNNFFTGSEPNGTRTTLSAGRFIPGHPMIYEIEKILNENP